MQPVSAVLIVKNEAAYLKATLQSLLWCDEIVVVDSFSTDSTPEICKQADAPWATKMNFIQHEWLGFSNQRNFAMKRAQHEWVFFLDGDETCSPELISSMKKRLSENLTPAQYKVRRQEYFLKKPIHYGIWNPSYHFRFFPKSKVEFKGEVHEGLNSSLEVKKIDEPILHVEDLRIERFLSKLNHYTSLQAELDYQGGMRTNLFRIMFSFPAMFYKNYIYYKAYKDGREGVIISVLEGISRTVRHLKIWQLQRLNQSH